VLLLPLAALCRLVGLPFLLPPIFWFAFKNRICFATNTNLAAIATYLVVLFMGLVTLPTVCVRTGGGAKVIGLFRYFFLVRYFCSFAIRQFVLNAVYVPSQLRYRFGVPALVFTGHPASRFLTFVAVKYVLPP